MRSTTTVILGAGFGADYDMGLVPGLEAAAYEFYSLAGAARLRDALRAFDGGDLVVLVPRAPFKCEGQFFALPHPEMQAVPPDSAQYQRKLAWMRDWVRDNL